MTGLILPSATLVLKDTTAWLVRFNQHPVQQGHIEMTIKDSRLVTARLVLKELTASKRRYYRLLAVRVISQLPLKLPKLDANSVMLDVIARMKPLQ